MNTNPEMTPHDLYLKFMESAEKSRLTNAEAFDKAVLTLSSAGLGLSLTFFKFIVPLEHATSLSLIKSAWLFFLASVVSTILGFRVAHYGYSVAIKYAEKIYLEGDESYGSRRNIPSLIAEGLNWISGITFLLASALLVAFVISNLNGAHMSNENRPSNDGGIIKDSVPPPTILKKSVPPPKIIQPPPPPPEKK